MEEIVKVVKREIRKQINKITLDDLKVGDYSFWTGDYNKIGINGEFKFDIDGKLLK